MVERPRYEVEADPMLRIEPMRIDGHPVATCHADKAIVRRGFFFEREGDTLIFEVCSGPLEHM